MTELREAARPRRPRAIRVARCAAETATRDAKVGKTQQSIDWTRSLPKKADYRVPAMHCLQPSLPSCRTQASCTRWSSPRPR